MTAGEDLAQARREVERTVGRPRELEAQCLGDEFVHRGRSERKDEEQSRENGAGEEARVAFAIESECGSDDPDAAPQFHGAGDAGEKAGEKGAPETRTTPIFFQPEVHRRQAGEVEERLEVRAALGGHRVGIDGVERRCDDAAERTGRAHDDQSNKQRVDAAGRAREHARGGECLRGIGQPRDQPEKPQDAGRMDKDEVAIRNDAAQPERGRGKVHAVVVARRGAERSACADERGDAEEECGERDRDEQRSRAHYSFPLAGPAAAAFIAGRSMRSAGSPRSR